MQPFANLFTAYMCRLSTLLDPSRRLAVWSTSTLLREFEWKTTKRVIC